ncbi:MAG TPA: adenylate/guanylate cyclase domain-containing protein [Burkholderiales bacterium]|nr:adenylate/guanylate cyclase domain-containing protein [Burkholderiales bacterium]
METAQRAVLFADVVDSTRIYESLGDTRALALINSLFGLLDKAASRHGGAVVKKLGDGMVCLYPDAGAAFQSACDMQMEATSPAHAAERLGIKVGFTFGPVVLSEGDVFGDTVNVCARLVALANAEQVLTTQLTVDALPPGLRGRCRQMFPIRVRGRHEEIIACSVLWRSDPDVTETNLARAKLTRSRETVLKITSQGEVRVVRSSDSGMRIGRDKVNDLVVDSHFASRVHARLFAREGHFVLQDLSSNGTYLLSDGNSAEILLRREEAVLSDRGWIGLGNTAARHGDHTLRYRVEPEGD